MIYLWLGLSSDNAKIPQSACLYFDFAFSVRIFVQTVSTYIERDSAGTFVYNGNANAPIRKAYNDTYILLITDSEKFFFDINRKKTYKLIIK